MKERARNSIRLIFRASSDTPASPAVVSEVARRAIDGLRENNQQVEPVYDGTRGGELYDWMVSAASAAQPLMPLAQLALVLVQLLNEVRKSTAKSQPDRQPPTIIIIRHDPPQTPDSHETSETAGPDRQQQVTIPPDSDQALLEQLLSEHLPEQVDPSRITVEIQVASPLPIGI